MGHVRHAVWRRLRVAAAPLEARGASAVPILVRRLAALFAIGWLVENLIGFHILDYAMCGLIALAMRRWSNRALMRMVVVAAMFPLS
jgi:uncharacterized membrane protein YeiB